MQNGEEGRCWPTYREEGGGSKRIALPLDPAPIRVAAPDRAAGLIGEHVRIVATLAQQ